MRVLILISCLFIVCLFLAVCLLFYSFCILLFVDIGFYCIVFGLFLIDSLVIYHLAFLFCYSFFSSFTFFLNFLVELLVLRSTFVSVSLFVSYLVITCLRYLLSFSYLCFSIDVHFDIWNVRLCV
jgi:hypothetical protein